jgi:hypothetical protein
VHWFSSEHLENNRYEIKLFRPASFGFVSRCEDNDSSLRQWLTTNFLNPVFKSAELFAKGRQFRANRGWGTMLFGHERFSHERIVLIGTTQYSLLTTEREQEN